MFFWMLFLALIIGQILPSQFFLREYTGVISTWISKFVIIFMFRFFGFFFLMQTEQTGMVAICGLLSNDCYLSIFVMMQECSE